jgi:hypothetical protein
MSVATGTSLFETRCLDSENLPLPAEDGR